MVSSSYRYYPAVIDLFLTYIPEATYFPGHAASVHVRIGGKEHIIGAFGILHPTVLEKYELKYPVSTLELNIEAFL